MTEGVQGREANGIARVGKLVNNQINQTGFTTQPLPLYGRERGQSCSKDGESDGTVAVHPSKALFQG